MADYNQPPYVTKRLRYYDNQFLQEQDFIDEQKYHLDRQRRHDRLLHVSGIAEGLKVKRVAPMKVSVAPGTAVDSQGRHILLASERLVPLTGNGVKRLYILFQEVERDVPEEGGKGVSGATRFEQEPEVFFTAAGAVVDADWVLLAEVTVTDDDIQSVKMDVRQYAGVRLPGPGEGQMLRSSGDGSKAELAGSLSVSKGLQVLGGPLVPKDGNDKSSGILFPLSSGGGSGDAAYIRYFMNEGGHTTLRIGIDGCKEEGDQFCLRQGNEDRLVIRKGNVEIPYPLKVGSGSFTSPAQVSIKANGHAGGMLALENADGSRMLHVDDTGEVSVHRLTVSTALNVTQNLTVTASATMADLRVQGPLRVTGGATFEGNVAFLNELNVQGDSLKVNSFEVVRSQEKLRIVRGSVTPTGRAYGVGYNVTSRVNNIPGIYAVIFEPEFGDIPTVVATVHTLSWQVARIGDSLPADNRRDTGFVVVTDLSRGRAGFMTMQNYDQDRYGVAEKNFHFIAVGY